MTPRHADEHRLLELLADQATDRLTADEEAELRDLAGTLPAIHADELERAAAAATLVFAARRPDALPPDLRARLRTVRPPSTAADACAELLANADDLVRAAWTSDAPAYNDVTGEVLWSDDRQSGFVRIADLPAARYRVWIFCRHADHSPTDGGAFEVRAAETIAPIAPRRAVRTPRAFAITLDRPDEVLAPSGPLLLVARPSPWSDQWIEHQWISRHFN